MNAAKVDKISADIVAALEKIAKKHNVVFSRGNARYSDHHVKFSGVTFTEVTEDGLDPVAAAKFSRNSFYDGISANAINVWFQATNEKLKIVGFNSRARKNKYILENEAGLKFKSGADYIKRFLPVDLLS